RVRLREREIRRRTQQRKMVNSKDKSPTTTVDLMVNSPILTGDGIPSPNLPRNSDSNAGSPVIGTPKAAVTISGPEILAKEKEEKQAKGNKIVSGGVVVDDNQENN